MKLKGPHLTLLAGLVLALVLLILSANATKTRTSTYDQPIDRPGANQATSSGVPVTPTSAAPVPLAKGTFAGRVDGATATVAIAVHNGKAIAYLCDGKRIEAWLQGTAAGGSLSLSGTNGSLVGTYSSKSATGTVLAGAKRWTFTAPLVAPPSGLYRATATIRNAKVVGGWIVLADGTEVGIVTTDGQPGTAPAIDLTTGQTTVAGTTVTAAPVDGENAL
jgi:hypothetical protein